ncbi:MAG: ribosomal L7Ae/L30e/S12e/Gadd45 family protein [Clostridia bacterium]|nr:ribosomal L7Ae/L30e/S12e/Gadd45 family protein [Clostridia bacterium]MBR4054920.1 ribosomal L7Ae/L30e/S12e/Gadd45 family protein [Clostridia bacterium]
MNRILGVLGLARRAGALAIGTNSVLEAVRKKKAFLVLVAADASENTAKQLLDKSAYYKVPAEKLPFGMLELGHAIGKDHTVAVAVLQEGFVVSYTKACTTQ